MQTRFSPGSAWAVAVGGRLAVLPAEAAPGCVDAVYEALRSRVPIGVMLAEAERFGDPLALVDAASEQIIARRSGVPASVDGERLTGAQGPTLHSELLIGSELRIGSLEALAGPTFPLRDGVARVSAMIADIDQRVSVETLPPDEARQLAEASQLRPESVSAPEAVREASGPGPDSTPEPAPAEVPNPAQEPALPATPVSLGGIIDSVPGFRRPSTPDPQMPAAPASVPPAPSEISVPAPQLSRPESPAASLPSSMGDHDGSTVRVEDFRAAMEQHRAQRTSQPQQFSPPMATAPGVTVLSTVCGAGHVNQPAVAECRVCGQPISPDSLQQRPRPALAVAAMPNGQRIELDDGVIFGRRPRARTAGSAAQLIVVESPQEDISRSHLELRIDDWDIVAEDLGSTNGTMLERPGQPPQRLRPESPVFVQVGDRLDLGEGVVVEVAAP